MVKFKTMDANEAVASVAYKFSEICGIYPITPASPMAEHIDEMASHGEINFFDKQVQVVEMQSEAGAIALVHGAMQGGVLASTFTASQGLLLMIPSLYKLAGEMLPAVIHVAARSLSTHALSIFGDHQDVYATRSTGVCMLAASSVQEAYYMAAIAHLSAIHSSLPFIHFFDGFRTSHEINKVRLMDLNKVYKLIDKKALNQFRKKGMRQGSPTTRGTAENDDVYFQHMESRNLDYQNSIGYVVDAMERMNQLNGTDIKPFNYYGSKKATKVIVAMGSVVSTIREVVSYLNQEKDEYGVIDVHLYRPFSVQHLKKVLPRSVEKIAVLDRTKEPASHGEPLYLDVVEALSDMNIKVIGGRYGLSSKNTTPAQIKAIFDYLGNKNCKSNFTVGIVDDVTNLSLKVDSKFRLPHMGTEFLIYGYGSDGMVSTSKDLIKIIGDNTKNFVQGYFQYDSKKSGGVTRSHVRICDHEILSSYYVENPNLIVVSKDSYLYTYDLFDSLAEGGAVLLNTRLSDEELSRSLPNKVKNLFASKKVHIYAIDAYGLVEKLGLRNKISTCMEVCIFEIISILGSKKVNRIMKETNLVRFKNKGEEVVAINNSVVDEALHYLREIPVSKSWRNLVYSNDLNLSREELVRSLKGDSLPVSAFISNRDGIFQGGNTKFEKRDIADRVPCWKSDNCIQCNACAFVCPHAVIRPFLMDKNDNEVETIASLFPRDVNYAIGISYEDCTGCGVCSQVCPGKMGKKALEMVAYDRDKYKEDDFLYLLQRNVNGSYPASFMNVKNIGFVPSDFSFSGACAGCGETAYLKNLTQMFRGRLMIANATGCSSIYGASYPSMPYSVPWANSLFEDNSEFGLGIYYGVCLNRERIAQYMESHLNQEKKLFRMWLDNRDDYDKCLYVYKNLDFDIHKELLKYQDYIIPQVMWIVGGDGFAYDIGFGGLDHVLSRGDNVNVLVLDTEVYSNTGGQASKSSSMGSVSQFASSGKSTYKKDLARMAMCYPNCYVAQVNIGYDREQYLKVLKEASSYDGPSLVIAYAPCIEHGIKAGMEHSLENSYLATKCGYFLTFRYHPGERKFYLDSSDVEFDRYDEFLSLENRYVNLKRVNSEGAKDLLENQKQNAVLKYNYYKSLVVLAEE